MLNKKKNIFFVIFSRANYSSIKSVIKEAKKNKNIKSKIIIGASAVVKKFGDLEKIIKQDGFKIDYKICNLVEGGGLGSMVKTTALGMIDLTQIFSKEKNIDLVITIGDRYETMATAISASYMNIPLAHTMGGEVTGTIDESVRHAITKLSHLHFVSNYDSFKRIIRLGENKKNVFNVGCPRIDLLKNVKKTDKFILNQIPNIGIGDIKEPIKKNEKFIILLQHPVTTEIQKTENHINQTLLALKKLD
jgi:UDP-hydrolysing UDP-N-acetyl-D-glucosamine 2-epimerase